MTIQPTRSAQRVSDERRHAMMHGAKFVFFCSRDQRWHINPPVVHPPMCVCQTCRRKRTDHEWDRELVVRIDRVSPFESEARSIGFALDTKREEEARLRSETEKARAELLALANKKTLEEVLTAYRGFLAAHGKRLDREESRLKAIEDYFGSGRDPELITKRELKEFQRFLAQDRRASPATVQRHVGVVLAALNHAAREELIGAHQLTGMRRILIPRRTRPKTFTAHQMSVLLGPAMDEFESWQREQCEGQGRRSLVPLRGLVLIAYRTMMRPSNNLSLRWEQLTIDQERMSGSFTLVEHKNQSRGFDVVGPLGRSVVDYLVGIMPSSKPTGLVHPNVDGKPFTNIRRSWARLIAFANSILGSDEQIGEELTFYHLRHSGASALAASGADPVAVVRMMGDTSLGTVLRHYFNSDLSHLQELVRRWEAGSEEPAAGPVAGGAA